MLKDRQKEHLHHQLGKMIGAGLPLDQALASLLDQRLKPDERTFIESLRSGLKEGKPLSVVMEATEAQVGTTPLESSMIAAGERSGHLDEAFESLSDFFGLIRRTKEKIRSGLIYPAILLHLAILCPAIPAAINHPEGPGTVIRNAVLLILCLWVILGCLYCVGKRLLGMANRNATLDRLFNRVPFLGKARRFLALSRFCAVGRMQILAGLLVSRALRAAGESSGSGSILHAGQRAAERVEGGSTLSEALEPQSALERDFVRAMATSETVGGIDTELGRWAKLYEERALSAAQAGAEWIPRVIYFFVAILVIWQVLSMYSTFALGPIKEMMDMDY